MDSKSHILVGAWFGSALTSLFLAVILLVYTSVPRVEVSTNQNFKLYSALPSSSQEFIGEIGFNDARARIVEDFFKGYNSPLVNQARKFIEVADKYVLDFRLLPAISMQESNGAKRMIKNSYNPFGFGIYGSRAVRFESFEDGIEVVGKSIREDYLNIGLKTPFEIMTKYTPPSLSKGGAWAKGVTHFMEELK